MAVHTVPVVIYSMAGLLEDRCVGVLSAAKDRVEGAEVFANHCTPAVSRSQQWTAQYSSQGNYMHLINENGFCLTRDANGVSQKQCSHFELPADSQLWQARSDMTIRTPDGMVLSSETEELGSPLTVIDLNTCTTGQCRFRLKTFAAAPPLRNPTIRTTRIQPDGSSLDFCLTALDADAGSEVFPVPCREDGFPGQRWTQIARPDTEGMVQLVSGDGRCLARSIANSPQVVYSGRCASDLAKSGDQLWLPGPSQVYPWVANSNRRWLFADVTVSATSFVLQESWQCDPHTNLHCQWSYVA